MSIMFVHNFHTKVSTINNTNPTTTYPLCNSHSTSISTCGVQRVRLGFKFLDQVRVKFLSCIKIIIIISPGINYTTLTINYRLVVKKKKKLFTKFKGEKKIFSNFKDVEQIFGIVQELTLFFGLIKHLLLHQANYKRSSKLSPCPALSKA